jgi:5,6-dimethylbenzimidazole synthase
MPMESLDTGLATGDAFSVTERRALYRTIFSRRDVRSQFLPDPVPDEVLSRILIAAHHAPSVGFMQPWSFLVLRSEEIRARVHALFARANAEAQAMFPPEKRDLYRSLKLEGIREAPVNLCVTCDPRRAGPVVLGRTHMPETDGYSTVCAVQNLWLAARAEGLGVGWVSILDPAELRRVLAIPEPIVPVAYLCVGKVSGYHQRPDLERAGWRERLNLDELVRFEGWEGQGEAPLRERIRADIQALAEGRFLEDRLG